MKAALDDQYVWMRMMLAALSFGLLAVAGLEVFAHLMLSFDTEDTPSRVWIIGPGSAALWGLIAAGIGGLAARFTAGIYGVAMAIGGVLLLSQRPWADWFQTRTDIAGAAVIGGVILAGILAAVLAIKPIAQPEIGVENLA